LHGKKLRGGYSLTRMRRDGRQAWLLVKKADEFAGGDPGQDQPGVGQIRQDRRSAG
jgi:hypothetical protein